MRHANDPATRTQMQPTKLAGRSQRACHVITASLTIATTFAMHAMAGRASRQLQMPRPDAYAARAAA